MFAQLNGINIISFYLPSSLAAAGFSQKKSLLFTAANSIPYVASTTLSWYLADKWGRRPLLILGGKFDPTITFPPPIPLSTRSFGDPTLIIP